jgi:hypothetical protein
MRNKIKKITSRSVTFIAILKTHIRKSLNKSDLTRWKPIENHNKNWQDRTIKMADFIVPNSSVIEFGAGRMVLKDYLPENCSYTPSDIIDRGNSTIICDLNKNILPVFDHYDYCIFSGVLEYINDVPKLIKYLAASIDTFIISYAVVNKGDNIYKRGIHGWVNNYNNESLIEIFAKNHYVLTNKSKWLNQEIYVFERRKLVTQKDPELLVSNRLTQD